MDKKERKEVDMHIHSNYSDGDCSVEELVKRIKESGLKAACLTDHDRTEGLKEFMKLCKKNDIDTFTGIEISANAEIMNTEVHILGYGFDAGELERNCGDKIRHNIQVRQNNIRAVINLYQQMEGMSFCFEDLRSLCFSLPAEVQNMYWIIKYRASCLKVLMEQHGQVITFRDAYEMAKEETSPNGRYYYPFIENYTEAEEIIRGIKSSGGVAVLAHPLNYISKIQKRGIDLRIAEGLFLWTLKELVEDGLDGIEYFAVNNNDSNDGMDFLSLCCASYNIRPFFGGSDYHGDKEDEHKPDRWLGKNGINYEIFCKLKSEIVKF